MKNLRYVLLGVGLTIGCVLLLGYAVTSAQIGAKESDEIPTPGRYQILNLALIGGAGRAIQPSPSTVVLLDTYTGRTWALKAGPGAIHEGEKGKPLSGTYLHKGWTLMQRRDEAKPSE